MVICGPLGAFLSSHLHRQVLAVMIYVLEAMALVGFLITQPPLRLVAISGAIMVFRLVRVPFRSNSSNFPFQLFLLLGTHSHGQLDGSAAED